MELHASTRAASQGCSCGHGGAVKEDGALAGVVRQAGSVYAARYVQPQQQHPPDKTQVTG